MYNCPKCNADFERGTRFCPDCGLNLAKEFIYDPICPVCKKQFPVGSKFCDVEGSRLVDASKIIPKCLVCGKGYDESTKFCPADGGRVATEAEIDLERSMKERYQSSAEQDYCETDFDALAKRGYNVDIWEWITRGWDLVKADLGLYIIFQLIILGLSFTPVVNILISLLCGMVLQAGLIHISMRRLKGEIPSFNDLFTGFNQFVPLLLLQWVMGFFVFLGSILFLLPGIYLSVGYVFAVHLIVDRKMDFWPAMEASRKVVTARWLSIFGFILLAGIISALGFIAFGIGVIITMPIFYCSLVAAYDDIFGITREPITIQAEELTNNRTF